MLIVLATDNFVKIPLLEANAITHNFDVVCLSETFIWVQNVEGFVFITNSTFL